MVIHYDADTLATAEQIRDLAGNPIAESGGGFVERPNASSWIFDADSPFPDLQQPVVYLGYNVICP